MVVFFDKLDRARHQMLSVSNSSLEKSCLLRPVQISRHWIQRHVKTLPQKKTSAKVAVYSRATVIVVVPAICSDMACSQAIFTFPSAMGTVIVSPLDNLATCWPLTRTRASKPKNIIAREVPKGSHASITARSN